MTSGIKLLLMLEKPRTPTPGLPQHVDELDLTLSPEPERSPEEKAMLSVQPCIPPGKALLCMDCESIFEARGDQRCPACGSKISWSISRALDRRRDEAEG